MSDCRDVFQENYKSGYVLMTKSGKNTWYTWYYKGLPNDQFTSKTIKNLRELVDNAKKTNKATDR